MSTPMYAETVLESYGTNGSYKLDIWRSVVHLDSKGFKAQNHGQHRFHGTIQADGVGVSIFKSCAIQLQETSREEHRLPSQMFRILHCKMSRQAILGLCVTVVPGRRDLIFCVRETSTPEAPPNIPLHEKFRKHK